METEKKQYYVLFSNHNSGLALHKVLKEHGIKAQIAPTPRSLSKCCGISLMVREEDINEINAYIKKYEIEILSIEFVRKDWNPNRDRYC